MARVKTPQQILLKLPMFSGSLIDSLQLVDEVGGYNKGSSPICIANMLAYFFAKLRHG